MTALSSCNGLRRWQPDLSASDALSWFDFTDAEVWRSGVDRIGDEEVAVLELFGRSDYQPPFRSPLSIALVRDRDYDDFDLVVKARSTTAEYDHRDLIVVFAYQDPAHFMYAHFATRGDDNAHHIMIVDGADRRPATTRRTEGVSWNDGWHELRVLRRGPHVRAYFDGGTEPAMTAAIPTWGGRVGLGSFDDAGRFAALSIRRL